MDGLALGARFSIATNRLAYCGPADAEPHLYEAIVRGRGSPHAQAALARFEALMPYLEAIAEANGRDPFDREVVEAYWIGNELLEAVDRARFRALLGALTRRGLPPSIARRLDEHLPPHPVAHHVFHVAFVGVGAVTGHVPTTLVNMEACRPAWAEVAGVRNGTLELDGPSLAVERSRLTLRDGTRRALAYDPRVLGRVRAGDQVAVHWSWPALVLDAPTRRALEAWTARSLDAANEALPGLGVDLATAGTRDAPSART